MVQLGAQAVQFVLMVASGAALARLLEPADFGLVGMSPPSHRSPVLRNFGLPTATLQRAELSTEM